MAGVGLYTDIDWISRSLKISGSVLKEKRGGNIPRLIFGAGLDFAFEMLNMRRVEAECLSCNLGARQLEIDYLGFTLEGRKREAVYKCGKYYDSLVLGMLREEWEQRDRGDSYERGCKNFDTERMKNV